MNGEFFHESVEAVPRPIKRVETGDFWSKEPPTIVDGQLTRGGMWSHQVKWWELPNFVKVLVGGFGSGKTLIGCKRIIASALQNAPCPVAAISPSFSIARNTTILTTATLLEGKRRHFGREFWWRYNSTNHEFRIRFHGREGLIIVYSGDDPLSLRGPNLASAWIDEPFIQAQEVFDQMVARVRHPSASLREITLTGTPEQLNWGYDLCVGDMRSKHDVGVIHASTRENLALDLGYVGRLEGSFSGKAGEAFIDGQFVNLSTGLVYHSFDPSVNIVGAYDKIPDGAELGAGMDFNVNPMAAVVFWHMGDHMHVLEEIELGNADTEYMCSVLREKYGDRLYEIFPDATGAFRKTSSPGGKSDFWYIQAAGYTIRAHHENPKRRDRYNAVCGKFKSRTGRTTLTISPKCTKLRKYLSTYSHEQMNKQKEMSHLLDAFGYPVHFLYPVSKDVLASHRLSGF